MKKTYGLKRKRRNEVFWKKPLKYKLQLGGSVVLKPRLQNEVNVHEPELTIVLNRLFYKPDARPVEISTYLRGGNMKLLTF